MQIVARAQQADHLGVDIERRDVGFAGEQRAGQSSGSGADLDDPVAGLRDGQPCDPRRRSGVHEKVLAQALLRA